VGRAAAFDPTPPERNRCFPPPHGGPGLALGGVVQPVGELLDRPEERELRPPLRGDARLAVVGARELPVDGGGRVGVVAVVRGEQRPLPEAPAPGEGSQRRLERADDVAAPLISGGSRRRTHAPLLAYLCARAAYSTSAARATVSRWRHARDEEENERSLKVARRIRASPGSSYRFSARPSSRGTQRGDGRSGGLWTTGGAPYAACVGKPDTRGGRPVHSEAPRSSICLLRTRPRRRIRSHSGARHADRRRSLRRDATARRQSSAMTPRPSADLGARPLRRDCVRVCRTLALRRSRSCREGSDALTSSA
jgi:hypothetical protein